MCVCVHGVGKQQAPDEQLFRGLYLVQMTSSREPGNREAACRSTHTTEYRNTTGLDMGFSLCRTLLYPSSTHPYVDAAAAGDFGSWGSGFEAWDMLQCEQDGDIPATTQQWPGWSGGW